MSIRTHGNGKLVIPRAPQKRFVISGEIIELCEIVEIPELKPWVVPPQIQIIVRLHLEVGGVDFGEGADVNTEEHLRF